MGSERVGYEHFHFKQNDWIWVGVGGPGKVKYWTPLEGSLEFKWRVALASEGKIELMRSL